MNLNKKIIEKIEERLEHGFKEYGREITSGDSRDWHEEALEEALDLCVYLTAQLLRIQERKRDEDSIKEEHSIGKSIDISKSRTFKVNLEQGKGTPLPYFED